MFRVILFVLSGIAYADLILNPHKIISYQPYLVVLLIILCCLAVMTGYQLLREQVPAKAEKISSIVFLILSMVIIDPIMFHFDFTQPVEFIIVGSFCLPYPIVLRSLADRIRIQNRYLLLAGVLLFLPAYIYFSFFYTPYESYVNDLPVVMYHYWVRNWLMLTGIVLLLSGLMRLNKSPETHTTP